VRNIHRTADFAPSVRSARLATPTSCVRRTATRSRSGPSSNRRPRCRRGRRPRKPPRLLAQ